jgi:HicA-like toxin of HicAB toxin-antitoxin system
MAQPLRSVKGNGKEFRDKLINAGCVFRRHGRGDHDIWYSPIRNQNFIVPIWIMSRHTAVKVLRDAGLSELS